MIGVFMEEKIHINDNNLFKSSNGLDIYETRL